MAANDTILHRLHQPGSARHLALVRILVGLHLAILFQGRCIDYLMHVTEPDGYSYLSYLLPGFLMNPGLIAVLQPVGLAACVFVVLGLFTRWTLPVLAVCFLLVQQYYYRHTGYHDDWLYFNFILLVLCFSRCADAWSIDSRLGQRFGRVRNDQPVDTQQYRWPVEVMLGWFCSLYVLAALAKLFPLENGALWLAGGAIQQDLFLGRLFDSPVYWVLGRPLFDYTIQWPFVLMAVAAIVIETAVIIPLFTRRWNALILPAIYSLHIGIYLFGVPGFLHIALTCSVLFIPPEWFADYRCTPWVADSPPHRRLQPSTL